MGKMTSMTRCAASAHEATLLKATKASVCSSHAVGRCDAKRHPVAATAASCAAVATLQRPHHGVLR